jgi:hypothetical protein
MYNTPMTPEAVKAYQDILIQDAQAHLTLKVIKLQKPTFRGQLCVRAGNLLIAAGLRLRKRYEPAIYAPPEALSGC